MREDQVEDRLRAVLRDEAEALPFTITSDELERRLVVRRRERRGRGLSFAAAGIAALLVLGVVASANGLLGGPGVGSGPSTAPSAEPRVVPTEGGPESLGQMPPVDGIMLVQDRSRSVTPSEPTGRTVTTVLDAVPPRGQYRLDVACLGFAPLRWSVGVVGQLDFLTAADQPCDGTPTRREITMGTPTTDLPVIVEADPASAWWIQVSTVADAPAFIPPALRMMETANTEGSAGAAQAFGRCVSTALASDQCAGEWFVLDGAKPILLPSDSRLTFALGDGWLIEQARITAADVGDVGANAFAPEYSVGFVDTAGPEISVPVALDRGAWIVRVALNGSRNGQTFGAYYDLPLVID